MVISPAQEISGSVDSLVQLVDTWLEDAGSHGPLRTPQEKDAMVSAFARLQGFMFRQQLLPASVWGEGRWLHRGFDSVLSRQGFKNHIRQHAWRARPGSRCMGWDDLSYVRLVPRCDLTQSWAFKFADHEGRPHTATTDVARRSVLADLNSGLTREQLGPLGGAVDLILCNQVFEHVYDPHAAVRTLYNLLAPGGLVLWTAPFMEHEHPAFYGLTADKSDFFRYTCAGAQRIFTTNGFSVRSMQKIGDAELGIAYMQGLGEKDLQASLRQGMLLRSRCLDNSSAGCFSPAPRGRPKHPSLMDSMYISCALVLAKALDPW